MLGARIGSTNWSTNFTNWHESKIDGVNSSAAKLIAPRVG